MKTVFLLLLLSLSVCTLQAQVKPKSAKLDDRAIVMDESGNVYPYAIWKKLLETEQYAIRIVSRNEGETPEFQLYKIPQEQIDAKKRRLSALATTMPKPRSSDAFKEGDKFRFEKMKDLTGKKFDFKVDTNSVVVINFWFINCPPCKKEIPELNGLVEKYKGKPVKFMAIALDGETDLQQFIKTLPFNYDIIPDGRYFAQKYGVKSFPTHVIIGKDGLIKFSTTGLAVNTIYWVDKIIGEQLPSI